MAFKPFPVTLAISFCHPPFHTLTTVSGRTCTLLSTTSCQMIYSLPRPPTIFSNLKSSKENDFWLNEWHTVQYMNYLLMTKYNCSSTNTGNCIMPSLNFIRLLRVVITPSVACCWEEKTTRSNRMSFTAQSRFDTCKTDCRRQWALTTAIKVKSSNITRRSSQFRNLLFLSRDWKVEKVPQKYSL